MRLEGIDGSQLSGYLAAVGLLKLLDDHSTSTGGERPRLSFDSDGRACLHTELETETVPRTAFEQLQRLRPTFDGFLREAQRPGDLDRPLLSQLANAGSATELDALAGLACVVDIKPTESSLCAANGAGSQNLIQSIRDVLSLVEEEHLAAAIFSRWRRGFSPSQEDRKELGLGDRKPTLRLDPSDERLYALRLADPSQDKEYATEIGAQALAVPAFLIHPVVPSDRAVTVGSMRDRNRVYFHWVLWSQPASLRSIRSLQVGGVFEQALLRARGAFAAFRAARISRAKGKLSFEPTEGVW